MNKIFKIIIVACILIFVLSVSGSLIYYFGFFRPEIEKAEIRLQEQNLEFEKEKQRAEEQQQKQEKLQKAIEESIRQEGLADCLDFAYQDYKKRWDEAYTQYLENWNFQCKRLGLQPNSPLPNNIVEDLDKEYNDTLEKVSIDYENAKNTCFKLWQD